MNSKPHHFLTNIPVTNPKNFIGREDQLKIIRDGMALVKQGSPFHVFITGKARIGKTSLKNQIVNIAQGDTQLFEKHFNDTSDYSFIACGHTIQKNDTLEDILEYTTLSLIKNNYLNRLKYYLSSIINKITLKASIISVEMKQDRRSRYFQINFINLIRKFWKSNSLDSNFSGFIFWFDEVDRLSHDADLASFIKALTEILTENDIYNYFIILTGIKDNQNNIVEKMKKQHQSFPDLFDEIYLPPFTINEARDIIVPNLERLNIQIEEDAINCIFNCSLGLPGRIHNIASKSLKSLSKEESLITVKHVLEAKKQMICMTNFSSFAANWESSSYFQQSTLLFLSLKGQSEFLDISEFLNIYSDIEIDTKVIYEEIDELKGNNIIKINSNETYEIIDSLFSDWIKHYHHDMTLTFDDSTTTYSLLDRY
jgi:AAA+ ATPase superfamily predicted ATPase